MEKESKLIIPAHISDKIWPEEWLMTCGIASSTKKPGPHFSRHQLEHLASHRISEIFGSEFQFQDDYVRQVRMPEPPLLLADRVTGIDAKPLSMGKGVIWTETDITENAWYLHHYRIPAGLMIEAGQADLLLISWLGIDRFNCGERVYRLLGCDLTYLYEELPRVGDTLCYEIRILGHAAYRQIRLFFFEYDCFINDKICLSVRNGQAGFFSDMDLAQSEGVLWYPEKETYDQSLPLERLPNYPKKNHYDANDLAAYKEGKLFQCFGKGYEWLAAHTRTPMPCNKKLFFLEQIELDPLGGPQKRGYAKGIQPVHADDWFFKGHFKNDPCMPGTLMLETGLQLIGFYLTALGFTLDKDAWRFEPVPNISYHLICRGQVTPFSQQVIYEIFVEELISHPLPTITVDLLATVDGLKAFHTKMSVRLTPDWILTAEEIQHYKELEKKPCAKIADFVYDYSALLASAIGKPTHAFGPIYQRFDSHQKVAKLPAPPYHFISRIIDIQAIPGTTQANQSIIAEYDIPESAWYFNDNSYSVMPYAVLLEILLQPCGWLASFIGSPLLINEDLLFRNLDGTGVIHQEIFPLSGTLQTHVTINSVSRSGSMIIEKFSVKCFQQKKLIYEIETAFGFFPLSAFINQPGLPIPTGEKNALQTQSDFLVDLTSFPEKYFSHSARLPHSMLLMINAITGFWPQGGVYGKGRLRAVKKVNPDEWFFKAHFFQDPVQPGSLGIEALLQLLQFYLLQTEDLAILKHSRFESPAVKQTMVWKYRGQVVPANQEIGLIIDISEVKKNDEGILAQADGSLWVDNKKIYAVNHLSILLKKIGPAKGSLHSAHSYTERLDIHTHPWIKDHAINFITPTLPLTAVLDRMVTAFDTTHPHQKNKVIGIENLRLKKWLTVADPIDIEIKLTPINHDRITCQLFLNNQSNYIGSAELLISEEYPHLEKTTLASLKDLRPLKDPYQNLMHGPAFQILEQAEIGSNGAQGLLNIDKLKVPIDTMNHGLLDSAMHLIPHKELSLWNNHIPQNTVAFPSIVKKAIWSGPAPRHGIVKAEVYFDGFFNHHFFPQFKIFLYVENKLWLLLELVEIVVSIQMMHHATVKEIREFIVNKKFTPSIRLSTENEGETFLTECITKQNNWMEGTLEKTYDVSADLKTMTREIAIKEHFAHQLKVHPSEIVIIKDDQAEYNKKPLFFNCSIKEGTVKVTNK